MAFQSSFKSEINILPSFTIITVLSLQTFYRAKIKSAAFYTSQVIRAAKRTKNTIKLHLSKIIIMKNIYYIPCDAVTQ